MVDFMSQKNVTSRKKKKNGNLNTIMKQCVKLFKTQIEEKIYNYEENITKQIKIKTIS